MYLVSDVNVDLFVAVRTFDLVDKVKIYYLPVAWRRIQLSAFWLQGVMLWELGTDGRADTDRSPTFT